MKKIKLPTCAPVGGASSGRAAPPGTPAAPQRKVRVALKDFQRYQAAVNLLQQFNRQQAAPMLARQQELVERVDMLMELFGSKYGLREGDSIEAETPNDKNQAPNKQQTAN